VGFFAALAPLCVAILSTVQTLEDLAASDREMTRQVIEVTRLGQGVQAEVLEMERHARQYLALSDPELATLFQSERVVTLEKLQTLQDSLGLQSADVTALVYSINQLELAPVVVAEDDPEAARQAIAQAVDQISQSFSVIADQQRAVQQWIHLSVDQWLERNAIEADDIVASLVMQLTFLAFATLALLVLFSYWINKPVRDLTRAIHKLGTAGLSHTIEISGPQEVEALGRKLEWLRKRLHDADLQKQRFMRHISHELKTPLYSLREGADLLAEQVTGHLSRQQSEVVEIVRQNAIEMQRLIENLIDYNQLPAQELVFEKIDMNDLWQDLLGNYRISLDQKSLHLKMHGSVDYWVADLYKLRTTLDNLLSNAVSYTPDDGRIHIAWWQEGANLIIEIANSGDAIPTEDAERVFEPFFQSSARRTGPIKGSGIGLSVARDCIEVQGGTLVLVAHNTLPICFRLTCPAR
jgi:two-component system sensor histidine kinase GlrK